MQMARWRRKSTIGTKIRSISFNVTVNGDVLANDGLLPTDFKKARQFIINMPQYIKSANGGKGKQLSYTLCPVEVVADLWNIEMKTEIVCRELDQDLLDDFVSLFDRLCKLKQQLCDYCSNIETHRMCVPSDHIDKASKRLRKFKKAEATLRERNAGRFCQQSKAELVSPASYRNYSL